MAKQDFLPENDSEFLQWHDHLNVRLPIVGPNVGTDTDELTTISDDNNELHSAYNDWVTKLSAANAAYQTWRRLKRLAMTNARGILRRIKSHKLYNNTIGEDLKAIGPEDSTDLTQSHPTLKLEDTRQGVVVRFNKSIADGVNIYGKRGNEIQATFLGLDTHSPYLDARDNLTDAPEEREYYGVYVRKDSEVGQHGPTVKITVAP